MPEFNLLPDPRVLPMLGEISLEQWRCIAELIDNSVDGFLSAIRNGLAIGMPEVHVSLPTSIAANARAVIRDNGPGMTPEVLERAVRAGWTGNNPIDSLGLFGMGFNIATARLGTSTVVWTTRSGDPEWHGLTIDFDQLRKQGHFKTPHQTRPKHDTASHGTEISIENLKPEQLAWLSKPSNQSSLRKRFSQAYSAMLRTSGKPLHFALYVNNTRVQSRSHCTWDASRTVLTSDLGEVSPIQEFDFELADRPFCRHCMMWLPPEQTSCGSPESDVIRRPRRIRGWIGVQRYMDEADFGLDFIRNGRKIEIALKDLFKWGDPPELEYPVDDQRYRGRIVGEIHIDHVRVNYAKDRFDRSDPAWQEMTALVRGEMPLRPNIARDLGLGPNTSPLFRLYRVFRRSGPQSSVAGAWRKLLVVKDNERAKQMADRFHDGDPEYQTDEKWFELVEAEDKKLLAVPSQPTPLGVAIDPLASPGSAQLPAGQSSGGAGAAPAPALIPPPVVPVTRQALPELSNEYFHAKTGLRFKVEAYAALPQDAACSQSAWILKMVSPATRIYHFIANVSHKVFSVPTFTPADALLCELASLVADFTRGREEQVSLSTALTQLRLTYGTSNEFDINQLCADAKQVLSDIAVSLQKRIGPDGSDGSALFSELGIEEQLAIGRRMAARGVVNSATVIGKGGFLEYAPRDQVRDFVVRYPEFFFDGAFWDEPYSSIDLGDPALTQYRRRQTLDRYASMLADVVWAADQEPVDLEKCSGDLIMRVVMAIRLLKSSCEA